MPRLRSLVSAALAAVVLLSICGPASPSTAAPAAPTATAFAESHTAITVSWSGTTTPAGSWFVGVAASADGAFLGTQTLCGTCLSARFDYLAPATSYSFTIVGVGGGAGSGTWLSAAATTPRNPICASDSTCVVIDSTSPVGPITHTGLGLNQGITERTDITKLTALKLNYHRMAAWDARSFGLAQPSGGDIAVLVDSAWHNWTKYAYKVVMDPWDNWDLYRAFVGMLVNWHVQMNLVPDYWEIQNEPDQAAWYRGLTAPTTDFVTRQFHLAHDAIRAVLPDAKIVGPSVGAYESAPGGHISLQKVLEYAAANRLRFDVISWHELGGDCTSYCDGGPRGIAQHVASVQNLLDRHPQLGTPQIHINEYGDDKTYDQPGIAVGFFAALAHAGVDQGASACWPQTYDGVSYDTCYANPGQANGLLKPDGRTPTAKYFVWQTYAKMTGTQVASDAARPDMSVVAAKAGSGAIRVLAGRHATLASAPANASVRVRIKVTSSSRSYGVTASSVLDDGATEQVTNLGTVRAANGIIDLGTFIVPNGSSLAFTLTPR